MRCHLRKSSSPLILLFPAETHLSLNDKRRKNRSRRPCQQLPSRRGRKTICSKTALLGVRPPRHTICPRAQSWCNERVRQSRWGSRSVGTLTINRMRRCGGGCWKREGKACSGHHESGARWEGQSAMENDETAPINGVYSGCKWQ